MKMSITKAELFEYLKSQLEHFFPDKYKLEGKDVQIAFELALEKTEYCFEHINFRNFSINGEANFRHLYSDQYSQFLYFLGNTLWEMSGNSPICDKMVLLNRALNGILCPYTVKLPSIFLFSHPIGTILGNAVYSDYLVISQGVTVNYSNGSDGREPLVIGKGVFLCPGVQVIGNKRIGNRTSIGGGVVVHEKEIPDDSVVYRDDQGSMRIVKRKNTCKAQQYFYDDLEKI